MRALIVGLALLFAPAVHAEEGRVVQGCIAALTIGAAQKSIEPVVVQDFADLTPPRATITFNVAGVPSPRPFRGSCEFENRESPLVLTKMCVEQNCHWGKPGEDARFDEIRLLLEKEGY